MLPLPGLPGELPWIDRSMTPNPLTAGELLAILAVLVVRLGKDHPLTRRVQSLHDAQPEGDHHE